MFFFWALCQCFEGSSVIQNNWQFELTQKDPKHNFPWHFPCFFNELQLHIYLLKFLNHFSEQCSRSEKINITCKILQRFPSCWKDDRRHAFPVDPEVHGGIHPLKREEHGWVAVDDPGIFFFVHCQNKPSSTTPFRSKRLSNKWKLSSVDDCPGGDFALKQKTIIRKNPMPKSNKSKISMKHCPC